MAAMIPSFRSQLTALKNDLAGGRKRRRATKRQSAAIVASPRIVQTEKLEERQLLSGDFKVAAQQLTGLTRSFDEFPALKAVNADGQAGKWEKATDTRTGATLIRTKDPVHVPGLFIAANGVVADLKTNTYRINEGVLYVAGASNAGYVQLPVYRHSYTSITDPNPHFGGQSSYKDKASLGEFRNALKAVAPNIVTDGAPISRGIDVKRLVGTKTSFRLGGGGTTTAPEVYTFPSHSGLKFEVTPSSTRREITPVAPEWTQVSSSGNGITGSGTSLSGISDPLPFPLGNGATFSATSVGVATSLDTVISPPKTQTVALRGNLSSTQVTGQFEPVASGYNVRTLLRLGDANSKRGLHAVDGWEYFLNPEKSSTGTARAIEVLRFGGLTWTVSPGQKFVYRGGSLTTVADSILLHTEYEGGTLTYRAKKDSNNTPALSISTNFAPGTGLHSAPSAGDLEFVSFKLGGVEFPTGVTATHINTGTPVTFLESSEELQVVPGASGFDFQKRRAIGTARTNGLEISPKSGPVVVNGMSWEQVHFYPQNVTRFRLFGRNDPSHAWTQIVEDSTQGSFVHGTKKEFKFSNSTPFKHFRFEAVTTQDNSQPRFQLENFELLTPDPGTFRLSVSNATVSTAPTGASNEFGNRTVYPSVPTDQGVQATIGTHTWRFSASPNWKLDGFASALRKELQRLMISGTLGEVGSDVDRMSTEQRKNIADNIKVVVTRNGNTSARVVVENIAFGNWGIETSSGTVLTQKFSQTPVANPIRMTIPSATFTITGGKLHPIKDINVTNVAIGETSVLPNFQYNTNWEELKLQQGGSLKAAFFQRNIVDSNGLEIVPGNSFGLYGGQVPLEVPAVNGVVLGSSGTTADLGDATKPGLIFTNGQFHSLRTPIPSFVTGGKTFTSAKVGSNSGLSLSRFPRSAAEPRSYTVTGGAVLKSSGGLIGSDLKLALGGSGTKGLTLLPDSNKFTFDSAITGQLLLGSGILAQTSGTKFERNSNGKLILSGGALLDLNASAIHTANEVNAGTAKPRGKLVRGRFALDYSTPIPANELTGATLNWFMSDPTVSDPKNQTLRLFDYDIKGRNPSQNPLRVTIESTKETLQGAFSTEAGGGVLTGAIEPVTLKGGSLQSANAGPMQGRYVRIELPGQREYLHLAEVQVFAPGSTTNNLAASGTASQSSTAFGGAAARVNDGNTNGDYSGNSVSHTSLEANPWWEVDLRSKQPVGDIVVWNRLDGGNGNRLDKFNVILLDENRNEIWRKTVASAPNPSVKVTPGGSGANLAVPVILNLASTPGEPSGFVANGVLMEDGGKVPLSQTMELKFRKSSFDGATLSEGTAGAEPNMVRVKGNQLQAATIKSTVGRTVGDLNFSSLDAVLDTNATPRAWRFKGPASYFGQNFNVGSPGAGNPQLTIGGSAGQQIVIKGIPGVASPPSFPAPPVIRVAGLTFDLARLTQKAVNDVTDGKEYTYTSNDYPVNLGVTTLTVSGEVTFKVSASGVDVKSFTGTLQQNSAFKIGNGTIQVNSINVKYDVADKQLEITGDASFTFMAAGASVEATISLGDATNPGLIIKDGVVESFQASITGSLDMMKLSIQVTNLTVKYTRLNSQFAIWGSVAVSTQTQGGVKVLDNLSVTMGDENSPGIVIEGGQLKSFDFEVNGDINLFNMTASPQNLRVRYDRPSNQLQITGKLAVTLAPKLTVTAGLPGEGLLINTKTGKVQIKGLSLEAEGTKKFGALEIRNLAIHYEEDANGDVTISGSATVGLPAGIEIGGELKIINGKLDTIAFSFEKRPGIAVGKGIVYIYGLEGKVEGLSDLDNFKISGTVRASVGPSVKFAGESYAYSDLEGTIEITPTSLALKGTAEYVGGFMGTGGFEGKLDWSKGTVITFNGHNTIQGGIVAGNISATIDVRGNLDFKGGMEVKIPNKVPAIGGTSLGRLDIEMRIRPHDAPSASYVRFSARAGVDLGIAKLTLSGAIKLDFGGTAHYNLSGAVSIDLPWPLDDINISKSFNGNFKLFDGTKPVIEILAANGVTGSPQGEIVYNVQTALPENTYIDLYADTDNMGNDGRLIAAGIPYQQGSQTFTWTDMATFAKPGDPIYVYAVVSDGDNASVYSDYSSEFNVAAGFTPTVTMPLAIKSEFGELIEFSPTQNRGIMVGDPRSSSDPNTRLEVVVSSRKGLLDFVDVPAEIEYEGEGTTSMTVTGTAADINKALEMLIYYPDDLGDVEPDAVKVSVKALPDQGVAAVTGKVDITFDSVMLFFNGSNAGQNVGGSLETLQPVEVTALAYGETPLDGIEVHSFKTEFLTGAQVKINGFEKDRELLQLPIWAASDYGIDATFSRRTGILTLNGEGRAKEFESVLAAITYDTMTPGSKSLEVSLIDHSGAKNKLTVPVTILPGVAPPKVDVGLTGLEFMQGDSLQPLNVATQIDVPDGETIRIVKFEFEADTFVENEDVLAFDTAAFNSGSGSNLTAVWDHQLGALYLEGTADEAAWNAAVQQVTYQSLGGSNGVTLTEGQRYVSISVTDGTGNVTTRTVAIDVSTLGAANVAPELTLSANDITLEAHDTMMVLDPELTLNSNAPRLIEAKVMFLDGYFEGEYELAVGQSWPNITTEWNPMAGSLRIYGVATTWEYEDMLRSVKVVSLLGRRFPGAMSLTFTVNDGLSATESEPLSIQVETAPFLQADLDNITKYTKGQERVRINDGFWIDTDDVLSEARVSIVSGYRKGDDLLIFDPSSSAGTLIQGDWDDDTGVLTLTGLASPLDYEEAFRGVFYRNTRHNPVAGDRVITYQLETDIAESNVLNAIITVTPEVVPPTVTLGQVGEFSEDGGAIAVMPYVDITTMDADSPFGAAQPMLYGADIEIKNWVTTEDVLTFTESASIIGMLDADAGRLVLTGAGTLDEYETVLKSIRYNNTSQVPDTTDREFSLRVQASAANGLANQTMAMVKVNDFGEAVTQTAGTIDVIKAMSNSNVVSLGLDDVQYTAAQTPAPANLYFQATTLPDELLGRVIQADGTPIDASETYSIDLLSGLQFEPTTGGMGESTFEYKVVVGDAASQRFETDGANQSIAITVEGVATSTASEAFVAQMYRDLLHDNPNTAKLSSLAGELDAALAKVGRLNGPGSAADARRQVVDGMIAGTDFRTSEITSLYQDLLGRSPSADELAVTTELATLRRELLASSDFFLQNNSNGFTSYIQAIFLRMLEREPTASELSLNEQKLQAGVSRADFIADLNVPDVSETQRQAIFQDLLGRAATFDDTFVFDASTGETLLASILSSDEYFARYSSPSNSSRIRTRVTMAFDAVGVVGDMNGGSATGTLIAPQYVLVAAHTVADLPPGQITFAINGNIQHIEKRYVHPEFDRSAAGTDEGNDIAILKLMQPVAGITPATLTGVSPKLGEVLNLVGYGQHGGALFGTKREGSTPPVAAVAERVFNWVQESTTQNDADPGDSGAPLFADINGSPFVIGIVSGGTGTQGEIGDTGINTRVDSYLTWIQGITGDLGVTDSADAPSLVFERNSIVLDVNAGETRIPFIVSSSEDATFSLRSNRPSLFASLEVDHDGGPDGELVITSARNLQGTAEIYVQVANSAGSVTETFNLEIQFADGVPTLTSADGTISNPRRRFDWTSVAGATKYEIEITPTGDVLNPVVQKSVTATEWLPDSDLALGDYLVRVRSVDSNDLPGAWSAEQNISVATPVSIDTIPSRLTERRPPLSWKAVAGAATYEVWLNNVTTGQARVLHQTGVTGNSLPIAADLDGGLHQLWVRAFDAAGNAAPWSAARFNVIPLALNSGLATFNRKPELNWTGLTGFTSYEIFVRGKAGDVVETGIRGVSWTPPNDLSDGLQRWWIRGVAANGRKGAWSEVATLDIGGRPVVETSGTTNDATLEIRWKTIGEASRYEVYIAKADGTLIYRNNRLPNANVTTPALADGDYAVWARAYDASGTGGPWSRRANITIAAATASLSTLPTKTIELTVSARPEFQWTAAAGAASYQISLRHENGAVMNVTSLIGTSWIPSAPLAAGAWKWAVRAVDNSGNAGSWSQLSTIQVGGRPTIEPVTGATSAQPTTFRWNAVDGAARYVLLMEDENQFVVLRENTVTSNSLTTNNSLAAGNYRIWVKVVSSEDPDLGLWSLPITFNVAQATAAQSASLVDEALAALALTGF